MVRRQPGRRLRWWISWSLLFAVAGLWSLSEPIFSGPDEASHVIKAAAVVRGQLVGRDRPESGTRRDAVRVPEVIAQAHDIPPCYKFRPEVPADCAPAFTGSHREVEAFTVVGAYPPLYYAVVGLPTVAFPSVAGLYLMRLLGAALSAAFLASAIESALSSRHRAPLLAAIALALTPMVFFVSSIVNPSALEIAAALCVWVSLIVLVLDPEAASTSRLVTRVAVAGAAFLFSRGGAPLWLALMGVTVAVAAPKGTIGRLLRQRVVQLGAVALGVATVAAVGWTVVAGSLELAPLKEAPMSTRATILRSLGKTDFNIRQMIGVFGWIDAHAPALTYYIWIAGVGGFVGGALAVGSRRHVAALSALVVAVVLLPVVLETLQSDNFGFFWQGRYMLPVAVGVPVLAVFAVADRVALPRRLLTVVVAAAAVGHVLSYGAAVRRFSVGVAGPVVYFLSGKGWHPPIPSAALLGALIVATGSLAYWLWRLIRVPQLSRA